MLDESDIAYIAKGFNVYDHNWQFYEELLGEACKIVDILTYCDGAGLYLAAFSLDEAGKIFSRDEIRSYIDKAIKAFPRAPVQFIDIWGRFEDLESKYISDGGGFTLAEQSGYFSDMFDSIFDRHAFENEPGKSVKKKIRQVRNSNISTTIKPLTTLNYEHMGLFEKWVESHDISPVHKEFFYSLSAYIKRKDVLVCEARLGETLIGFSIIGIVSGDRIVLHSAFPLRGEGLRAGDALFLASVDFARQHNIRWLHAGYSANESLLRSKENWGAMTRSPSFREAFYTTNPDITQAVAAGRFLWRARIDDALARKKAAHSNL